MKRYNEKKTAARNSLKVWQICQLSELPLPVCSVVGVVQCLPVVVSTPKFTENARQYNHYLLPHSHMEFYRENRTFQQIRLLTFLQRAIWKDWYHCHICSSIIKVGPGDRQQGEKVSWPATPKRTNCLFNYKNKCVNNRFKFYWGLCVELLWPGAVTSRFCFSARLLGS